MTYFTHTIDPETYFCIRCGQHLSILQSMTVWRGNIPTPVCPQVIGISHIVRKR